LINLLTSPVKQRTCFGMHDLSVVMDNMFASAMAHIDSYETIKKTIVRLR